MFIKIEENGHKYMKIDTQLIAIIITIYLITFTVGYIIGFDFGYDEAVDKLIQPHRAYYFENPEIVYNEINATSELHIKGELRRGFCQEL